MTGKKIPQPKKASHPAPPRVGFDGAGHLDPAYAQRLLDLGRGERVEEPAAFIKSGTKKDDLAEELGEAAVTAMTSGEDELAADLEEEVAEELGGPFVETSGDTEFAAGTDESNIPGATREPFPTT